MMGMNSTLKKLAYRSGVRTLRKAMQMGCQRLTTRGNIMEDLTKSIIKMLASTTRKAS